MGSTQPRDYHYISLHSLYVNGVHSSGKACNNTRLYRPEAFFFAEQKEYVFLALASMSSTWWVSFTGSQWALLVGIAYKAAEGGLYPVLGQTHQDITLFKSFLIGTHYNMLVVNDFTHKVVDDCNFHPDRVVVMTDHEDTPDHLQPTRDNIVSRSMSSLRRGRKG